MRSALYECDVVHERFTPKAHRFYYRIFTFALDLDELDALTSRLSVISRNRFNLFSFYDRDHLDCGQVSARANVLELLRRRGLVEPVGRVLLITTLRMLGYAFNPVSFYYCFDEEGEPLAVVAEVNNTFGETKPYVILKNGLHNGTRFESTQPKEFYISPFVALDVELRMRLAVPGDHLAIAIDDVRGSEEILSAVMTGRRVPLTTPRLLWFLVKYPFLGVKVIAAIHWEALRLWSKRVRFHRKNEHPELQTGHSVTPHSRTV